MDNILGIKLFWPFLTAFICFSSSAILVVIFKYDLRFDRTIDFDTYYRLHPRFNKFISIIKLIVKYFAVSAILAILSIIIWKLLANQTDWLGLPGPLSTASWTEFFKLDWFWVIASGWIFLLTLNDIRRCFRVPIWDVFISYKSEDVDIVRQVANQLIASGLRIWFNEYYVLLQNYDRFQKAINYGIRHSAIGIAFTNNNWTESQYCKIEIVQLLKHLGPQRIMEVMIPKEDLPHQKYSALKDSPSYIGDDVNGILSFIQETTGWPIQLQMMPDMVQTQNSYETVCLGRPAVLDTSGWELTKKGQIEAGGNIAGLEFRCGCYHPPIFVNLYCGQELSRPGQRQEQKIDDREMFRYLLKYAPRHIAHLNAKLHGLHLLFQEKLGQMALTYWVQNYWTRKYSIIIPNYTTKENAEFIFTFGFMGSFREYCRAVHIMDHFVKSLQWK